MINASCPYSQWPKIRKKCNLGKPKIEWWKIWDKLILAFELTQANKKLKSIFPILAHCASNCFVGGFVVKMSNCFVYFLMHTYMRLTKLFFILANIFGTFDDFSRFLCICDSLHMSVWCTIFFCIGLTWMLNLVSGPIKCIL